MWLITSQVAKNINSIKRLYETSIRAGVSWRKIFRLIESRRWRRRERYAFTHSAIYVRIFIQIGLCHQDYNAMQCLCWLESWLLHNFNPSIIHLHANHFTLHTHAHWILHSFVLHQILLSLLYPFLPLRHFFWICRLGQSDINRIPSYACTLSNIFSQIDKNGFNGCMWRQITVYYAESHAFTIQYV